MKGQVSLEFLIGFALTLSLIAVLSVGLFQLSSHTQNLKETLSAKIKLEEHTRLKETVSTRSYMVDKQLAYYGYEEKYSNPSNNAISADYGDGVLVAETLAPGDVTFNRYSPI